MPDKAKQLQRTALYDMHVAAAARMVPFAGYNMPVQYEGIKAEHLHTRKAAGLFDVSHMGQLLVSGEFAARELEQLIPVSLEGLGIGQQCYSFFTLPNGGLLDDLIIAKRSGDSFYLVVNASRKADDIAHLREHVKTASVQELDDRALLALQGPKAAAALMAVFPELGATVAQMPFMHSASIDLALDDALIEIALCRSGYTGEDGFELSVPATSAQAVASALLNHADIEWIGLGARDSLRLEAGLCLYGHDIDKDTSPVEAGLGWCIHEDRRVGGKNPGGFPGADVILEQLDKGVRRRRKGFVVDGKVPVREGAEILDADGARCGVVTSGSYSPVLGKPVLMAYVNSEALDDQRALSAIVRGRQIPLIQTRLPFVKKAS